MTSNSKIIKNYDYHNDKEQKIFFKSESMIGSRFVIICFCSPPWILIHLTLMVVSDLRNNKKNNNNNNNNNNNTWIG